MQSQTFLRTESLFSEAVKPINIWTWQTEAPVLFLCSQKWSDCIKMRAGATNALVDSCWIAVAQYSYKHTAQIKAKPQVCLCFLCIINPEWWGVRSLHNLYLKVQKHSQLFLCIYRLTLGNNYSISYQRSLICH